MSWQTETWPRWSLIRGLLVALFLCRGLVYLCVLPPVEGWDEYQHVGFITHLHETGTRPKLGATQMPQSLLSRLPLFPVPERVAELQLGRFGVNGYSTYWQNRGKQIYAPGSLPLYEAQHSWWYYRIAAPVFAQLGGVEQLPTSIGGLRFLNLLFVAAAIWVVLGYVGKVAPSLRTAALAGLVLACHPLFLINGVRVANDALGVLLATVAVRLTLELSLNEPRWAWRCLLIGLVSGFAILVKAVNLGLLPFLGLAWLLLVWKREVPTVRAGLAAFLVVGSMALVLQDELRSNLREYGSLTPMQEAIHNKEQGRTKADLWRTATSFRWHDRVARLWLVDSYLIGGWSRQRPGPSWSSSYTWLVTTGLLSALVTLIGRRKDSRPGLASQSRLVTLILGLCLGYTGALAYHMVQSKLAWGQPTTCPWYASVAFPWFLLLIALGGLSWPSRWLSLVVPIGLVITCLGGEWVTVTRRMLPTYSGGAQGSLAFERIASLQPPILGTSTLLAASVLVLVLGLALLIFTLTSSPEDQAETSSI